MPRDKILKDVFSKSINSNNFENDVAERIISLVKFAYDNIHETYKKKTKGVAFVREVWNNEDLDFGNDKPEGKDIKKAIKSEVFNHPILSCAKLYKVGLQANAGWGSRLSGKEIQNCALGALSKLCDKDGPDQYTLIAYLYDGDIRKMSFINDHLLEKNRFLPKDIDNNQKKQIIEKFKKDIKTLGVTSPHTALHQWFDKKVTDARESMDKAFSSKGHEADAKEKENEELDERIIENFKRDRSAGKMKW